MTRSKLAFIALCSILIACNSSKDLGLSQHQVERFHQEYSAGQDQQAYDEASPIFHKAVGYSKWLSLRSVVRSRLGRVRGAERRSFKEWMINGDHMVELIYQTKFENGSGAEKFTWQFEGATARLAGYYINLPLDAFPNSPTSNSR